MIDVLDLLAVGLTTEEPLDKLLNLERENVRVALQPRWL